MSVLSPQEEEEIQEIIDAFVEIIEAGYSIETWK